MDAIAVRMHFDLGFHVRDVFVVAARKRWSRFRTDNHPSDLHPSSGISVMLVCKSVATSEILL